MSISLIAGTLYGMRKTTVYLPEELKAALAEEAARSGLAEAELIRQAVAASLARPAPKGGLFSADPMAERTDDLLAGFGET